MFLLPVLSCLAAYIPLRRRHESTDCDAAGTYLHNVALPISHTYMPWKWSPNGVAKATDLVGCHDETRDNNHAPGPPPFPVRGTNPIGLVLNSILHNRFVVRWFSRLARYAWLLSRWNCRYCTSFFFLKATRVATERAALSAVCRLPVVPGCACVRFRRAITGLN